MSQADQDGLIGLERWSSDTDSNDYDLAFWWSVALLFLAFFVLPAVGYGADPSAVASEGDEAYKAKDYARPRALYDQACKGGIAQGCSKLQ